jgi:hypothetical protein
MLGLKCICRQYLVMWLVIALFVGKQGSEYQFKDSLLTYLTNMWLKGGLKVEG